MIRKEVIPITRVSSKSDPKMVAGYITSKIEDDQPVEIIVIGAAALNQAIKGISIAKQYLGKTLYCEPDFLKVPLDDREVTGIKLIVSLTSKTVEVA